MDHSNEQRTYEEKNYQGKIEEWSGIDPQLIKGLYPEQQEDIATLLSNLSSNPEDWERIIKELERRTRVSPLPIKKGSEYVTRDCDSRCEGCRVWRGRSTNEMTARDWISTNRQVAKLGLEKLTMLGGEPTLLQGFNEVIKDLEENTGLDYFIITKGVSGQEFDNLIAAAQSSRGTIITSIDATDEEIRKNFKQLARNEKGIEFVRELLNARKGGQTEVNAGVNIVMSHANLDTFVAHAEFLLEHGIYVNIAPFIQEKPEEIAKQWVRRGPYIKGLSLEQSDLPRIQKATATLLGLKRKHGPLMINSESYIAGFNPHALTQDIRCINMNNGFPTSLRIWSDKDKDGQKGLVQECIDLTKMPSSENPITVSDLLSIKGRLRYFAAFREAVKDCLGCYWSSMNPTQRS